MMSYPDLQLCIGGDWKDADGHPVINPADESEIGTVPFAGRPELDAVLAAAQEGFQIWRRTSRSEEHTTELKSLMRIPYAVFCLKKTIYLPYRPYYAVSNR